MLQTILLAEDDPHLATTKARMLEKHGFEVIIAETGEKAIESVKVSPHISLILMDIVFSSGIDGAEASRRILKEYDLPIVFFSSYTEPEVVDRTKGIPSYGYVVKNAGDTVLLASVTMAVESFEAKAEKNDFYENAPCGYHSLDKDGVFVRVNNTELSWLGYSRDEILGKKRFPDVITAESLKLYEQNFPGFKERGWVKNLEFEIVRKDGTTMPVLLDATAVTDAAGNYVMSRSSMTDITPRKRVEKELERSRDLLDATQRIAKVGGWEWDVMQQTMTWAHQTYLIHGFDPGVALDGSPELIQRSVACYDPKDRPRIESAFRQCVEEGKAYTLEFPLTTPQGDRIWVQTSAEPVWKDGQVIKVQGHIMDITPRKQAEEEIQRQLYEKQALLKEVHHRIKNNMVQVESLLSMQARSTESMEAEAALTSAVSRVRSMSALYEKLLIGEDYSEVSTREYLTSLIDSIVEVFDVPPAVTIEKDIVDFAIGSKAVISLGIIVNELLTNVFKYAFKGKDTGHVFINLEKAGNQVALTVQDDGSGFDQETSPNDSSGFGLSIVNMLVEQFDGTFTMESDNGTKSVVTFEV